MVQLVPLLDRSNRVLRQWNKRPFMETRMPRRRSFVSLAMSLLLITPPGVFASSHREAPITALDHAADITDFYAFVSYDHPDRVTFIMNVDPFLEPSNGPNFFPFDPNVLYQIRIDNNNDAAPGYNLRYSIPDADSGPPNSLPALPAQALELMPRQELTRACGSGHTDCSTSNHFTQRSGLGRLKLCARPTTVTMWSGTKEGCSYTRDGRESVCRSHQHWPTDHAELRRISGAGNL